MSENTKESTSPDLSRVRALVEKWQKKAAIAANARDLLRQANARCVADIKETLADTYEVCADELAAALGEPKEGTK